MSDGDEQGHSTRRVALAIVAGVFFGGVATGVAFPTLPLLDEVLGIGAGMLGLILASNRITRLVTNTPAGNLIDRVGARRPMVFGLFIQGLAPFGYLLGLEASGEALFVFPGVGGVSEAAVVFLLARGSWGIGSACVFLGAFATITHVTDPGNRGRVLGYVRGGQSLGFPTGLVVGGVVADVLSIHAAFLLAGVLALLAGVVGYLVLPDVRPEPDKPARVRDIPRLIRREPRVFPLGLGNLTIRFIFGGVLLSTVVKYAEAYAMQLGTLTASGISGLVLGTGVLCLSAATVIAGRVSDRLDNRALVTVPALLAMAAGLAVLAAVPTLSGLFAGTAFIGVGTGGTGPTLLAILGDITPGDEVGRMGGVYNVMGDVGLVLGPILAVPMVDAWFGYRLTYALCVVFVLTTLLTVSVPLLRHDTRLRTALS